MCLFTGRMQTDYAERSASGHCQHGARRRPMLSQRIVSQPRSATRLHHTCVAALTLHTPTRRALHVAPTCVTCALCSGRGDRRSGRATPDGGAQSWPSRQLATHSRWPWVRAMASATYRPRVPAPLHAEIPLHAETPSHANAMWARQASRDYGRPLGAALAAPCDANLAGRSSVAP